MKYIGLSSRVPGVPKLPPGLAEIMETLSREVIVHNPDEEDMYRFCAAHLKKLLELRDEPPSVLSPQKISLEERIAIAQQKVRERAEKRWKKYDKEHKPIINIEPTESVEVDELQAESSTLNLNNALGVPSMLRDEEFNQEKKMSSIFPIDTVVLIAPVLSIQTQSNEAIDDNLEMESRESQEENADKNTFADKINEIEIKNDNVEQVAISSINNKNESSLIDETLCVIENQHQLDNENADSANDIASFIIDQIIKSVVENNTHIEEMKTLNEENTSPQKQVLNQDEITNEENIESDTSTLYLDPNSGDENTASKSTTTHCSDIKCLNMQPAENNNDNNDKAPDNIEPSVKTDDILLEPNSQEVDSAITEDKPETLINAEKHDSIQSRNGNEVNKSLKENMSECNNSNILETENTTNEKQNVLKENSIDIDKKLIGEKEEHANDIEKIMPENNSDEAISNEETTATNDIDDNHSESILQNNESETHDTVTDAEESTTKIDSSNTSSPNFPQTDDSELESSHSKSKTMDLETAAVTIQKVFRSYMFKSRASTSEDDTNQDGSIDDSYISDVLVDDDAKNSDVMKNVFYEANKDRRPLGLTRIDTTLQTVNEEKSLSLSTDDSSTLSSAATIIQAHVRGFLVRNRLHSNKTVSSNSGVNSDEPSSLEADNEQNKHKTVLNIHIVPEGGGFLSRDESAAMSLDLPYDISPSASVNIHPLGYDKNEKRKQLKREDAIQIISPPTITSGKLSEDVDSLREISVIETDDPVVSVPNQISDITKHSTEIKINGLESVLHKENTVETAIQMYDSNEILDNSERSKKNIETDLTKNNESTSDDSQQEINGTKKNIIETSRDNDVVSAAVSDRTRLLHSSEFHDVLIPTAISRCDMGVTRDVKKLTLKRLMAKLKKSEEKIQESSVICNKFK